MITLTRAEVEQVLDALEAEHSAIYGTSETARAIETLRARLAAKDPDPVVEVPDLSVVKRIATQLGWRQPIDVEQEPVAWRYFSGGAIHLTAKRLDHFFSVDGGKTYAKGQPLYTAPPQRDTEIEQLSAMVQELDAKLAKYEAQPVAWIPVTTRLPQYDDDRRILCYCAEHDYGGTQFITLKSSDFWVYDPDGDGEPGTPDSRTVTHWMFEEDAISWVTNAAPPQREWQPLTDEELLSIMQSAQDFQGRIAMTWVNHQDETYVTDVGNRIARAIEQKIKEKNGA